VPVPVIALTGQPGVLPQRDNRHEVNHLDGGLQMTELATIVKWCMGMKPEAIVGSESDHASRVAL
jgi:hypothetical protein